VKQSTINKINEYINGIKNTQKKSFAKNYFAWLFTNRKKELILTVDNSTTETVKMHIKNIIYCNV